MEREVRELQVNKNVIKYISWALSFPMSIMALTMGYLSQLFTLPTDLMNHINKNIDEG